MTEKENEKKQAQADSEEKAKAVPEKEKNVVSGDEAVAESGAEEKESSAKEIRSSRKKTKFVTYGIAHVRATFNNTVVSITDTNGDVISWCSAGRAGFKGSRKSTAFAATTVAQEAARQASLKGLREVEVRVQGAGSGRESAIRALQTAGLTVSVIKDITPMPHNGCRARKMRRV